MKKTAIDLNMTVPAHHQATKIANPGKGPFNFPTTLVTAQLATILQGCSLTVSAMRTNQLNAPSPQTLAKGVGVRRLVINEARGLLFGPTATPAWHRYPRQGSLDQVHFRCGRRFQEVSQRNTLAVCHHPPLRTFALLGGADTKSPFLAGAKLPSAKVSAQSSWPWRSSCARKARHAVSQTSCSSQRRRRRQQVLGEG